MYARGHYRLDDPDEIRRIIRENAFATLVVGDDEGLLATHMPFVLDPVADGSGLDDLVLLSHTAKVDPVSPLLGRGVLVVFQGAHGYISPTWYGVKPNVGTWNFTVVHVHGKPEVLDGDDAFEVLELTQNYFERDLPEPFDLSSVMDYARKIARATVPFRLRATRVEAKVKLSQDKPPEVRDRVIAALDEQGPFHHPALAEEMRRARDRSGP